MGTSASQYKFSPVYTLKNLWRIFFQFGAVAKSRYLNLRSSKVYMHTVMADYFGGKWSNGKNKPFQYSELLRQRFKINARTGFADRNVPSQPNLFVSNERSHNVLRYNMRKFAELPHHLLQSFQIDVLCKQILFSYSWLHGKASSGPLITVMEDFIESLKIIRKYYFEKTVIKQVSYNLKY